MRFSLVVPIACLLTQFIPCAVRARTAPSTQPNAAALYRQAYAAIPTDSATHAALEKWDSIPTDSDAQKAVDRCAHASGLLHKASEIADCDWQVDYTHRRAMKVAFVNDARLLGSAACLQARMAFEHAQPDAGIDRAADLLLLARRLQREPAGITRAVGQNLEQMALRLLARYLPDLPRESLSPLLRRLDALPSAMPIADLVRAEGRSVAESVRSELPTLYPNTDPARFQTAAKDAQALNDKLAEGLSQPIAQYPKVIAEYQLALIRLPTEVRSTVPSLEHLPFADLRLTADRAMLRAAAAYLANRPDGLKTVIDPFGSTPFAIDEQQGGFALISRLSVEGRSEKLSFGPEAFMD